MTRPPRSATLRDVAARAGVSISMVSGVLNGVMSTMGASAENRERILAAARDLRYRPSSAARRLHGKGCRMVAVMILNQSHQRFLFPQFGEFLCGLELVLAQSNTLPAVINLAAVEHADTLPVFRERLMDAMIVVGGVPDHHEVLIGETGAPVLWVDTPRWRTSSCLRRDERAAGRLCAQHLVQRACSRLWFLGPEGADQHHSAPERWAGIQESADRVAVGRAPAVAMSSADGLRAWLTGLDARDGIVAYDGVHALRVAEALGGTGVAARPLLVACDADRTTTLTLPWLPHAVFNRMRLGRLAGEMIVPLLSGDTPVSRLLPATWFPES